MRLLIVGGLLLEACSAEAAGPRTLMEADPALLDRLGVSMDTLVFRLREEGVEVIAPEGTRVEVRGREPQALMRAVLEMRRDVPIRLGDLARIDVRP